MKKSNLITLLSLILLVVIVMVFMYFGKSSAKDADVKVNTTSSSQSETTTSSSDESTTSSTKESETKAVKASMGDALFIGDSRTVGLMEYAGMDDADFFCNVGMSVFNIYKKSVSVPNVGKVTLSELLNGKKYGKIYIMLGINEVGYELDSIVNKYSELIELIKSKQPDAVIFIQANLHVTKIRSDSDKVVNNTAINGLNKELSKLADGKTEFYLDANTLFDDASGNLSADKSGDSAHLYAKYYHEWGEWITVQTASLLGEG